MIVEEYKSDAAIIRIENDYIGTKEESKEITEILISLIVKKISEYSEKDL